MAGDDAVDRVGRRGQIELALLGQRRARGEDEAVDDLGAGMHDGKAHTADLDIDPTRQPGQPGPQLCTHLLVGESVPGRRQPVAIAASGEAAAGVRRACAELLIAIAHHDVKAGLPHQRNGLGRVGTAAGEVARADRPVRRNSQPLCLVDHCPCRLEIAGGATENEHRLVGSDHTRQALHQVLQVAGAALLPQCVTAAN